MIRILRLFEGFTSKADLMAGVMNRLDISTAVIERDPLGVNFQGMVSRCLGCKSAARCQTWLKDGQGLEELDRFCPNARIFKAFRTH